MMDAIKPSWIKSVYGEDNTNSLYQCNSFANVRNFNVDNCANEDDEVVDKIEFSSFLDNINNATSMADYEKFMDVDQFLKEVAFEYLIGTVDHFVQNGNNVYLYRTIEGQWKFFLYDFDSDFGNMFVRHYWYVKDRNITETETVGTKNGFYIIPNYYSLPAEHENYTFGDYAYPGILLKKLIYEDPTRFEAILKDIVMDVFNPDVLFSHIDELKTFIDPYVKTELKLKIKKACPVCSNNIPFSYEKYAVNTEFTNINGIMGKSTALKYWILSRYRTVCHYLELDCNPVYVSEDYSYPVDHEVENIKFVYKFDDEEDEEEETATSVAVEEKTTIVVSSSTMVYNEEITTSTVVNEETLSVIAPGEEKTSTNEIITSFINYEEPTTTVSGEEPTGNLEEDTTQIVDDAESVDAGDSENVTDDSDNDEETMGI